MSHWRIALLVVNTTTDGKSIERVEINGISWRRAQHKIMFLLVPTIHPKAESHRLEPIPRNLICCSSVQVRVRVQN